MKMIMSFLTFCFSILFFQSTQAQTLTSYFRGETRNGHFLKLKYAGPSTWLLSDYAPCAKYPCDVNDQTTETKLTARWISSLTVADGPTIIGLSNGMIVTFVNNGMVPPNPDGTRVESYWQLEIPAVDGGMSEIVRLSFSPMVD